MTSESLKLGPNLQALLDASPDAVLIVDRGGEVVALNGRAETLFATTAEQQLGKPVEMLLPARLRESHAAARSAYSRTPSTRAMSTRAGLRGLRADGTEFPVEVSLTPIVGSTAGLVMAVVHEVASRERIERPLDQSDRTSEALDAIADAVLTTNAGGNVDFLNRSAEQLTGCTREAARGRPLQEVLPLTSESGKPLESPGIQCLRHGVPAGSCEALFLKGSGPESRALDISATPIHNRWGDITGAAVVARDVTHARLIARQLSHQATHDALTGLINRSEFEQRLARVAASAAEEQAEHALCFLDLDGFKRVNDACGHLAGDELLRQLSDLMRNRMRSRDTLARLGGDEFGMLLEHCRLPKAARIAEEIRTGICAHRFTCREGTHTVGASIGIVPIRAGSGRPEDLLRAADNACYAAKRSGGNRIHLYNPRRRAARALRNRDWARLVAEAIAENRFQLHAQALLPLAGANGRGPRFEVLLRLDDGRGEPLLPAAFLPAASRNGLMPRVDGWVIRGVIRRLAEWQRDHSGTESPTVGINLSAETITGGAVVALVREQLANAGLRPDALCFEISESVVVTHQRASVRLLGDLREAGCQTTLEHCGSGMVAFTLLRRLPVDYLKMAGHIVRGLARDPVDRALATALNEIGHALRLRTIGVEVEDQEVLAYLRGLGVDYAQGFGIGRPQPFDAAIGRLALSDTRIL